jgi:high-affinity Fe2+/Pb2+ permease
MLYVIIGMLALMALSFTLTVFFYRRRVNPGFEYYLVLMVLTIVFAVLFFLIFGILLQRASS